MEKCFLLKVDFSQCIDDYMSVHKLKKEDIDLSLRLNSNQSAFNQKELHARANLSLVTKYDFIANDMSIPVLSQKFVDIANLSSEDEFDLVPMTLLDETYSHEYYNSEGEIKKEVSYLKGYYTLNFKILKDYCDTEKSVFRKLRSQPNSRGIVRKIVLSAPEEGFTKIFRIKETASKLFVSQEMKEILQNANITGCLFKEVEVSKKNTT